MPRPAHRPTSLPSVCASSSVTTTSHSPTSTSSSSSSNLRYGRHAATVRQLKRRGRKDAWGYFIFPPRPDRSVSLVHIQKLASIDRRGAAGQTTKEEEEFFVSPLRRSFSIRRRPSRTSVNSRQDERVERWSIENGTVVSEEDGALVTEAVEPSGAADVSDQASLSKYAEAFCDGVTSVCTVDSTVDSSRVTPIPSDNELDSGRITRALASLDLRACLDNDNFMAPPRDITDGQMNDRRISLDSVSTESVMSISDTEPTLASLPSESIDVGKDPLCDSQPNAAEEQDSTLTRVHLDISDDERTLQAKAVVGIDIGCYSSGYAIGLAPNGHVNRVMTIEEGGDPGVVNLKLPSCLLLCPRLQFHSFGYIARDFYHDLSRDEAKDWCFIDFSTNRLHSRSSIRCDTTMTANNGREVLLVKVLALTLKYFRQRVIMELEQEWREGTVTDQDIHWKISIPTAWDADSMIVYETACREAGLTSVRYPSKMSMTSEASAAALYCRSLSAEDILVKSYPRFSPRFVNRRLTSNINRQTDDRRILVADCGSENIHLTVFRVSGALSSMEEIRRLPNACVGCRGVDHQFEKLLCDVFGAEDIAAYQRAHPLDFVRLMSAFESRKRAAYNFAYDTSNHHNIALPLSLLCFCRKSIRQSVRRIVRQYGDRGIFYTKQGMLCLTAQRMQDLFQVVLDQLQQTLQDVLDDDREIALMFVVGGFANSPILQQDIISHFSERLEIVFPSSPATCIMKGCVVSGFLDSHPIKIQPHHSYGIGILRKFNPTHHPYDKRVSISTVTPDNDERGLPNNVKTSDWCVDHFDALVRANQSVARDQPILRTYTPCSWDGKSLCLSVFRSDSPNVRYITEEGVEKCADLRFDVSGSAYSTDHRRLLQVRLVFTETDLLVSAKDLCDGRSVSTAIDWRNGEGREEESRNNSSMALGEAECSVCSYDEDSEPTAFL